MRPRLDLGTIALVAGKTYSIELDYFQATGSANMNLYWSTPTIGQQVIPQADLYPTLAAPANLAAVPVSSTQVNLSWKDNAAPTTTGFGHHISRSTGTV